MLLGETRQCTQTLWTISKGVGGKQVNKDQRKSLKSREAIFQTTTVPATQDFGIILAIRLCAYGPPCGSEESGLPSQDPCLSVF